MLYTRDDKKKYTRNTQDQIRHNKVQRRTQTVQNIHYGTHRTIPVLLFLFTFSFNALPSSPAPSKIASEGIMILVRQLSTELDFALPLTFLVRLLLVGGEGLKGIKQEYVYACVRDITRSGARNSSG